jgi:hypothetical protein
MKKACELYNQFQKYGPLEKFSLLTIDIFSKVL